jgi:uncharacterized protein
VGATPWVLSAAAGEIPKRRLGKIDFEAGILGFGSAPLGEANVDASAMYRVVGEAIDLGVNYVDTAGSYEFSQERLGRALKGKRDKVFLVSKTEFTASSDVLFQIRDSLRKLQTDHLDCVHIHNLGRDDRFPNLQLALGKTGALGGLIEAKKQGMIRHIGCTTHMRPARVLPAFETGEIEVFMGVFNFVDRFVYTSFEEEVLPAARKHNIAVIAMKALGGETGVDKARLGDPENYRTALRYAWSLPGVCVVNLGMRTVEQVRAAVNEARSYRPLTPAESTAIEERGRALAARWGPTRGPVT